MNRKNDPMNLFIIFSVFLMFLMFLSGCTSKTSNDDNTNITYTSISQEEAMEMMEKEKNYVILDVRRDDEYKEGHIPGAINIPNEEINDTKPEKLPDLDQIILVYCRSGNRSKQASKKLAQMGYRNIYEFGGINTWKGDIVREDIYDCGLQILVNGYPMNAVFERNVSSEAFIKKLQKGGITVEMSDYGGFEKVGPLPYELPRCDEQITTEPGDVILYQGNQITIYYGQNTWSFTKLAHISGLTQEELIEILGEGDITAEFSWDPWDY